MALLLFPNLLGDLEEHSPFLPSSVAEAARTITCLIAESEKAGRRFLRRFLPQDFRNIPIRLLNEHSSDSDKRELAAEIRKGGIWGLVSDCGMPCLADPGADLVLLARQSGVEVKTFAGPSSILFALVLSGLGGQHFTFHGYLPKEENALIQYLRKLPSGPTHLFIETPYRNRKMLQTLLNVLDPQMWLCVACDLTLPTEWVQTKKIKDWKALPIPEIDKRPAVFVIRCVKSVPKPG